MSLGLRFGLKLPKICVRSFDIMIEFVIKVSSSVDMISQILILGASCSRQNAALCRNSGRNELQFLN